MGVGMIEWVLVWMLSIVGVIGVSVQERWLWIRVVGHVEYVETGLLVCPLK
jgi:hypothetical protein